MVGHENLGLAIMVRIHASQRFDALALRARLLTASVLKKGERLFCCAVKNVKPRCGFAGKGLFRIFYF